MMLFGLTVNQVAFLLEWYSTVAVKSQLSDKPASRVAEILYLWRKASRQEFPPAELMIDKQFTRDALNIFVTLTAAYFEARQSLREIIHERQLRYNRR